MKLFVLSVLLFLSTTIASPVDLTPENFDSIVDGSKHVFVKFYAPWCGHCKSMIPAYEETAEAFARESDVVIAKLDSDAHKEIGGRYGVSGFPTLKFFRKGSTKPEDYSGGRDAAALVDWINQQTGARGRIAKPATAVTVLTPSTFDSIVLDSSKDVFVEFYAPWCGHCKSLSPIWEKFAHAFKNEKNVVIANLDADAHKDVGTKYDVSGFPTLVYFPKNNKKGERYNGGRELSELITYVNTNAGTQRLDNGYLAETVGRHATLDEIVKKFITAPSEALIAEVEKEAANLDSHASWYGKFMKVIIKKGVEWVATEKARLKGLLDGGALSTDKIDEFVVRQNVLNAFEQ